MVSARRSNLDVVASCLLVVLVSFQRAGAQIVPAANITGLLESGRNGNFSILLSAISNSNLTDTISDPWFSSTCFFPNNTAFDNLLKGTPVTLQELLSDTPSLTSVVLYHCLEDPRLRTMLTSGNYTMYNGQSIKVFRDDKTAVFIRDSMGRRSKIVRSNIRAGDTIIHLIDHVLMPSF